MLLASSDARGQILHLRAFSKEGVQGRRVLGMLRLIRNLTDPIHNLLWSTELVLL